MTCVQIFLGNMTVKEFINWSTFAEVMIKSQMYCFLSHGVVTSVCQILCLRHSMMSAKACSWAVHPPCSFIHFFIGTDLVTTIYYEWLEQSCSNLQ